MNGIQFAVFIAVIWAAVYFIPRAIAFDRNLAALERLDDEELAAQVADEWNNTNRRTA